MNTPQIEAKNLANKLGLTAPLFLKREDMHCYGSHKGRSIPVMMQKYIGDGQRNFVISSSGNSALAAALYTRDYNIKHPTEQITLTIFVGKKINQEKLDIIKTIITNNIEIKQISNPKQSAFLMDKNGKAKNLRQSTDKNALTGYEELTRELAEIKNLAAVFVPTSSGTTAQGLYEGFKKTNLNPQIHIVQTDVCHPLVKNDSSTPLRSGRNDRASLANAIVDKVAHRKNKIKIVLKNSHGNGWIANNNDIRSAIKLVNDTEHVEISPNSALAIVGLQQALASGKIFTGTIVCLLTGK